MIFQNMEWLTWPPPLLRTAPRMSSGMALRSRIKIFGGFAGEFGMLFDGGVEILDVGAVVHVVVQGHRLLVDDGFESGVIVGQGGSS
jgi:hypothetical protein